MYDIAMYDGVLYGIDNTSTLYSINTTTGAATSIGAIGHVVNALTFSPTGVLYAAGSDTLYTINKATGAATTIGLGTVGGGTAYTSSGDLEFFGGVLYLTSSTGGSGGNNALYKINAATGQATDIGSIGFTNVYGLAQQNGILYGFVDSGATGAQSILKINTTTGAGTVSTTYTLTGTNIGFDGATDDAAPEPGPFVLVGLGLAALAARFRSRS
jgi:hypothetical protein